MSPRGTGWAISTHGAMYAVVGERRAPARTRAWLGRREHFSKHRSQLSWRTWQMKAGFDRLYPFHCTRHTAVTAVYRATQDLFLAQRFARHVSPLTTVVYTHPSDEEMSRSIRALAC